MNQSNIGRFIAQKRKEKNLTQAQLAENVGVSNKTISKWETGQCMPDYSVIQTLCRELGISLSELMDGEKQEGNSIRLYDEGQMLDMLERVQLLEYQKEILSALSVVIVGMVFFGSVSHYKRRKCSRPGFRCDAWSVHRVRDWRYCSSCQSDV